MQKRAREPEMPGSRRYMLRNPAPNSRFAAFLDTIGMKHTEAESAQAVVDSIMAQNHTDEQKADMLEVLSDLASRSTKLRRGSPGNNRAFHILVYIACETERRLPAVPGGVSVRTDVAAALGLVPDTVGKAFRAGRRDVLAGASYARLNPTGYGPLMLQSLRAMQIKVAEAWPEFRLRYRRPH